MLTGFFYPKTNIRRLAHMSAVIFKQHFKPVNKESTSSKNADYIRYI
jgi:hypothetical protein